MKKYNKFLIALIGIPFVFLLFFASNIYGYFRFQSYCSNEGGLRVYEPLEKNVGWLAKDKYDAQAAALLTGVGFVRYTDKKDGNTYDLRYLGGNPTRDSSFEKLPADESKALVYTWETVSESVDGEIRLRRFGEKILNADNSKILAYYYMFSYGQFDAGHTIFGASSNTYCFDKPAQREGEVSGWLKALNTAFKN